MSVDRISYNIKFFREQKGLTQEALAKRIVTSRSNIAKWENNTTVPDIQSLLKMSEIFEVSLDHLVGRLSFQEDLLKDFKRIYGSTPESFDEEVVELIEYTMKFPQFKAELLRLKTLPLKNQLAVHELLANLIDQFEKMK